MAQETKPSTHWKHWATIVLITLLFALLFYELAKTWKRIPFEKLHFDPVHLLLSYGLLFVSSACGIEGWRRILKTSGEKVTFRQAFRLIGRTILAKYLPGKFWFVVGRVYLGKAEAFSQQRVAVASVFEEVLLLLSAGLMLILIELPLLVSQFTYLLVTLITVMGGGLLLLHPRVIQGLLGVVMRVLKRNPVQVGGRYRDYLGITLVYLLGWLAQGMGFFFLCRMIYPLPWTSVSSVVGAYTLSWVVGLLAFFVPGGLGIREGTLSVALGGLLTGPLSILLSLVSRLWITLYELLFAVIAFKV